MTIPVVYNAECQCGRFLEHCKHTGGQMQIKVSCRSEFERPRTAHIDAHCHGASCLAGLASKPHCEASLPLFPHLRLTPLRRPPIPDFSSPSNGSSCLREESATHTQVWQHTVRKDRHQLEGAVPVVESCIPLRVNSTPTFSEHPLTGTHNVSLTSPQQQSRPGLPAAALSYSPSSESDLQDV